MAKRWIKIYEQIWDNPIVTQDPETFTVWIWLLTHAASKPFDTMFGSERVTLKPGQLVTGRAQIAAGTGVNPSKVNRILKRLKIEQQIEQQVNSRGSLISIVNWDEYQQNRTAKRTASEQQVNTNKKEEIDKNIYINNITPLYPPLQMDPKETRGNLDRIVEAYRKYCPSLTKLDKVTDQRQRRMVDRLKTYTVEEITEAFKAAEGSKFLRGDGRNWRAGFDWIMESDERISQLIGGAYSYRDEFAALMDKYGGWDDEERADNKRDGGEPVAY